ncbi:hypothetical protein ACLOJK_040148 [Asimina triloba]
MLIFSGRYAYFAKQLTSCGFGVYAMDWIGHGGSDGLHGYVPSLDHVVADTVKHFEARPKGIFLEKIKAENPHVPCFLFGHSTGGAVVLKAVAPLFSLVVPKFQFKGANKRGIPVSRDPAALIAKYSDPLVYTGPIRVRTGHEILRISSYLMQNLKSVTVPFFVLHGTADKVTDPLASLDLYKEAASKFKDIKLYEGFLHDLLFEPEREAIAGDIISWMEKQLQEQSCFLLQLQASRQRRQIATIWILDGLDGSKRVSSWGGSVTTVSSTSKPHTQDNHRPARQHNLYIPSARFESRTRVLLASSSEPKWQTAVSSTTSSSEAVKPGQLRVHSEGILWKKQGGGKVIEFNKEDIVNITWMKVPRSFQIVFQVKDGLLYKFIGFQEQEVLCSQLLMPRNTWASAERPGLGCYFTLSPIDDLLIFVSVQDVSSLHNFFQSSVGIVPQEKQLSVSGRNWGEVDLNGNTLTFLVGSKQAFEVSLTDVSQTQVEGKTEVALEFHVDNTAGANERHFSEDHPPAQVFHGKIMSIADVGTSSEEAVASFENILLLTPRGRHHVEFHLSFLRLQGQANDFKIQYTSVVRLFVLPKSNQPHTFVVATLDPPIRKGQTLYPHIVMQFETDYVIESTLSIPEELLNAKYKGRLQPSYKGLIHEVFTSILRGLAGTKVTKPGSFRSCQDGYAVKSSLKAQDGLLYPLEKGFFFLPKPPTLILHDEIEAVQFERHNDVGTSNYFDLSLTLKNEQEHLFCNILRNEYAKLLKFMSDKGLKIPKSKAEGGQPGNGVAAFLQSDDDDAVDPHLEWIRNEIGGASDEEDEDFVAEKDDGGSPSDDSGTEESDTGESEHEKKPSKKEAKKEASANKVSSAKRKTNDEDIDGLKKRKTRKKKDPNAPKRSMSAFMHFTQKERDKLRKEKPELTFTELSKTLGGKWKNMTGMCIDWMDATGWMRSVA